MPALSISLGMSDASNRLAVIPGSLESLAHAKGVQQERSRTMSELMTALHALLDSILLALGQLHVPSAPPGTLPATMAPPAVHSVLQGRSISSQTK